MIDQDAPEHLKKISIAAGKAWHSPGGVTLTATEKEEGVWLITVSPALRELVGGKKDGEQVFARFQMNVSKFMRVFDKRPKMVLDSALGEAMPHLVFCGNVDGIDCSVAVLACPPPGMSASEITYTEGPKKGKVEPKMPFQRDDDDERIS